MTTDPAPADSGGKSDPRTRPALIAGLRSAYWLEADGLVAGGGGELSHAEAAERAREARPLVCHLPATVRRLGCNPFPAFDLLELFAFVRPAAFCTPTPGGLAGALGLELPGSPAQAAGFLQRAAEQLLAELRARGEGRDALAIAWTMASGGWPWGPAVVGALGFAGGEGGAPRAGAGLRVWERLAEWSDHAPEPPPGHTPVSAAEARARLADAAGRRRRGPARSRPTTPRRYPRPSSRARRSASPSLVLAEAGTGVGKTLGYIAPASLWAESNGGTVWISTFTRNLQHQIDGELDRLYPEPATKARRVVIRKGRENYLCLLNLEEAVRGLAARPQRRRRPRPDGALGASAAATATWSAATSRAGCPTCWAGPHPRPDRPPGRVHLFRLRPLRQVLHRAERAPRPPRPPGDRQPRPGHDPGGARQRGGQPAARYVLRRGASPLRRRRQRLRGPSLRPGGHELRRWLLGVETSRQRSRLRGLKRRIEDLAAGDAATAERWTRCCAPPAACRPRAGASGSPGGAAGPGRGLSGAGPQQVYARAAAAQPLQPGDRGPRPGRGRAGRRPTPGRRPGRAERPLTSLEAALAARLDEDGRAWTARPGGASRDLPRPGAAPRHGRRLARHAARLGAETRRASSTGSRSSASRAATSTSACTATGSTRPCPSPSRAAPAQGLVVTSATLTDGSGDARPTGPAPRRAAAPPPAGAGDPRARVPSPFDYGRPDPGAGGRRRAARTTGARSPAPTGRCSRRRAAARSASSPRSPACARCTG